MASSGFSGVALCCAVGVALSCGCGSILDVHEGTYVAPGGAESCTGSDCDAGDGEGGAALDASAKGGAAAGARGGRGGAGGRIAQGGDDMTGGTDAGPGEGGGDAEAGASAGGTAGGGGTTGSGGKPGTGGKPGIGGCGATTCAVPPSCVGLPLTCGAAKNDDCCASPKVTKGTVYRSPDGTVDAATVSDFRLDKYEVTVGRFRKFMSAVEYAPGAGAGKHAYLNGGKGLKNTEASPAYEQGWQLLAWGDAGRHFLDRAQIRADFADINACNGPGPTWTETAGANEAKPINCVSWYVAYAFCIWDGGFLPSDAEAKYAAGGGTDHRLYPSGSVLDNAHAVYCSSPPNCPSGPEPVGSKPSGVGKFGQMDLVGNVVEWLLDSGDLFTYPASCNDCSDLPNDSVFPAELIIKNRMMLSGGFLTPAGVNMYWTTPQRQTPQNVFPEVGMRCARPPN